MSGNPPRLHFPGPFEFPLISSIWFAETVLHSLGRVLNYPIPKPLIA